MHNSTTPEDGLAAWSDPNAEVITTEELDDAAREFSEARLEYDEKKEISNKADAKVKLLKRKLLELLERANKSNWDLEGVGKFIKTVKYQVRTPKDLESKAKMLKHFKELGADQYLSYVSVNFQSLNSYINQEMENDPSFKMPGVEDPIANENITWRKK